MSKVETQTVLKEDAGLRLDRWFRRHFPKLAYGRLAKLIRTGQVRVDGSRAKPDLRLAEGQRIRVPPLREDGPDEVQRAPTLRDDDAAFMRGLVLYKDDDVIAINKPAGIAVQGGTKTHRHIDAMLDALRFDGKERPRLVHRLDRDTSGVLLLARSAATAASLTRSFRARDVRKIYWALCVGVPKPSKAIIDLALDKRGPDKSGRGRETMQTADDDEAKSAITYYATLGTVGKQAAWLALMPVTGRTHQLRVHCAAIGHPIVGDRKYGGPGAELPLGQGRPAGLCLHARAIDIGHPLRGRLKVVAPLPPHMAELWDFFEFDATNKTDPFSDLRP